AGEEAEAAGEGVFPPVAAARKFLENASEGWRRLDCGESAEAVLTSLPKEVAVLSMQLSPDGSTIYGAGYFDITSPSSKPKRPGSPQEEGVSPEPPKASVWRHEMRPAECLRLTRLKARMRALEAMIGRYCLDFGDDTGEHGDFITAQPPISFTPPCSSPGSSPTLVGDLQPPKNTVDVVHTTEGHAAVPVSDERARNGDAREVARERIGAGVRVGAGTGVGGRAAAEEAGINCDKEFALVQADMEELLHPLWGEGVQGGLGPFLERCRLAGASLVLLLDEDFSRLPLEACSALHGQAAVCRDISLHLLHHRLRAAGKYAFEVKNSRMAHISDPLFEDQGLENP
ncbi:unnamed protein product, partial [Discosporangium mesarthrocarpum]